MRLLPFQLLSLTASILFSATEAHSRARNPLSKISFVQNATIHTRNHRVTALSEFDLSFITDDDLHVKFRLEPNHDILNHGHGVTVTVLGPDGVIEKQEEVDHMKHKVFRGTAWIRKPNIGQDEWRHAGWARAMVHVDGLYPLFEGAFSIHHDANHIQSTSNFLRTRHRMDPPVEQNGEEGMIHWRDSDILSDAQLSVHQTLRRALDIPAASCRSDHLSFNSNPDHPVFVDMRKRSEKSYGSMELASLFGKRQSDTTTGGNSAGVNLTGTIGQSAGCPSPRKVALVGVAADCNYAQNFNSTASAESNIIAQMNTASSIWENAFNISLGVTNVTVLNATCPATPATATMWNQDCKTSNLDIQGRLNLFSAWRGTLGGDQSHWTLLSSCKSETTIGLAWLGQACVHNALTVNSSTTGNGQTNGGQSETVSGANVVISTEGTQEWQIIAHETGHTFGAVHDCDTDTCSNPNIVNSQQCCPLSSGQCNANGKYIMNPYATEGANTFSPCTVGNICSAIGRNSVNTSCLTDNKGVQTYSGQQCGNGIVEGDEQCDCGGPEGCGDNSCCDPNTCKFTQGSVCDDSNESCCQSCQLATSGTVCRPSTGQCDPQEVCSGTSPTCPADTTTPDGTSCGNGLQCTSGECTSRDQQCKTVMGSYTQGNDTYACSSSGCNIRCASPEFGPNVCYSLQQNFLDGTSCGGGGRCQNGQCTGSTVGGEVKSWINDHKGIVIGICASVGALILVAVLGCLWNCCTRRRVPRQNKIPAPPAGGWQGWSAAPPMSSQQRSNPYAHPASQNWAGGSNYGNQFPPPPPPAFAHRGQSVRYA